MKSERRERAIKSMNRFGTEVTQLLDGVVARVISKLIISYMGELPIIFPLWPHGEGFPIVRVSFTQRVRTAPGQWLETSFDDFIESLSLISSGNLTCRLTSGLRLLISQSKKPDPTYSDHFCVAVASSSKGLKHSEITDLRFGDRPVIGERLPESVTAAREFGIDMTFGRIAEPGSNKKKRKK